MKTQRHKHHKDEGLMMIMAKSIGSTLGAIAAKANEVPETLKHNDVGHTMEVESKKLVQKGRRVARKILNTPSSRPQKSKSPKSSRRRLRTAKSAAKRAVRRVAAKATPKRRTGIRK